jgi:hypothetical protein
MDTSTPLARLTNEGLWAVCSRVDCGERFARRIEIPEVLWSKEVDAEGRPTKRPRKAVLDFVAGWTLSGDTWSMSERARKRLSQGRPPAFRRAPFSDDRYPENSRRDRTYNASKFSTNEHRLPAYVICPACGLLQVADPVALRCV